MLTDKQMRDAFWAHSVDMDAKAQECTVEGWIRSLSMDEDGRDIPVMMAEYSAGKEVLETWRPIVHRKRHTIYPDAGDNQIVVDAGYIATSRAWRLVSFVPR